MILTKSVKKGVRLLAAAVMVAAAGTVVTPTSPVRAVAGAGGTISTYSSGGVAYTVHSFLTTGSSTFTVPTGITSVDYLIVGGGGGGANSWIDQFGASGGGGGEVVTGTETVTAGSDYAVVVGEGGAGPTFSCCSPIDPLDGGNGGASSIFSHSAGGGYGAIRANYAYGAPGTGVAGNSGGNVHTGASPVTNSYCARGGGGAGAGENGYVGQNVNSGATDTSATGSKGGDGLSSSLRTGSAVYYGGGGGGGGTGNCAQSGLTAGKGGLGGGGASATWNSNCCSGFDGATNSGGGGGAQAMYSGKAGDGGSGIVVVRYVSPQTVAWAPTASLLTLDSPATPSVLAVSSIASAISYSVVSHTTTTCSVGASSGILTYTGTGNCVVRATGASSGAIAAATKDVTFTVSKAAQSSVNLTSTTGTFGTALTLTASGGTGTGALSFAVTGTGTATGCTIGSGKLSTTSAGTCKVTATRAADADYQSESSAETAITIGKGGQSSLTVTSVSGTVGLPLQIVVNGGNGTGAVTYELISGGTTTCTINAGSLLAGAAGTCLVKVTKAADTSYDAQQTTATVTFSKAADVTTTTTAATTASTTASTVVAAVAPVTTATSQSVVSPATPVADTQGATQATTTASTTIVPATTTTVRTEIADAAPTVAEVSPGTGALEIDGQTVQGTTTRADNQLTVTAGEFSVTVSAVDSSGTVIPLSTDGSIILQSDDQLKLEATGFAPGTDVSVWLFSTPSLLGNLTVGDDGKLSGTYGLPDGIEEGKHRVALVGKSTSGTDARFAVGLLIGTPARLSTAAKVLIAIPIAGAVLLALLLPTRLRRRRRTV